MELSRLSSVQKFALSLTSPETGPIEEPQTRFCFAPLSLPSNPLSTAEKADGLAADVLSASACCPDIAEPVVAVAEPQSTPSSFFSRLWRSRAQAGSGSCHSAPEVVVAVAEPQSAPSSFFSRWWPSRGQAGSGSSHSDPAVAVVAANASDVQVTPTPTESGPRLCCDFENPRTVAGLLERNTFASREEQFTFQRMAAAAQLAYTFGKEPSKLGAVSALFPRFLIPMPTADSLGITVPTGLYVQAFRSGDEVIFVIRGTELNEDIDTLFWNLVADMGIGRTKPPKELLFTTRRTIEKLQKNYMYSIKGIVKRGFEASVTGRVQGISEEDRAADLSQKLIAGAKNGIERGAPIAIAAAAVATSVVVFFTGGLSLALIPFAAATTTSGLAVSAAAGVGVELAVGTLTAPDGFGTYQSYVRTCLEYVRRLAHAGHIGPFDELKFTGHSLGGNLASMVGALANNVLRRDPESPDSSHSIETFSYNGPGVTEHDAREVYYSLFGQYPASNPNLTSHSLVMEHDAIGNLGHRRAEERTLLLPYGGLSFFDSALHHHGIEGMRRVLAQTSIDLRVPRTRLRAHLLRDKEKEETKKPDSK
jgi:hypothetical protein